MMMTYLAPHMVCGIVNVSGIIAQRPAEQREAVGPLAAAAAARAKKRLGVVEARELRADVWAFGAFVQLELGILWREMFKYRVKCVSRNRC